MTKRKRVRVYTPAQKARRLELGNVRRRKKRAGMTQEEHAAELARRREKYRSDPEKQKLAARLWHRNNKEARHAYAKDYRERNKAKVRAANKAWLERNREYSNQKSREYYAANPKRYTEVRRQWIKDHRDRMNQLRREWDAAHPDIRLAKNQQQRARRAKAFVEPVRLDFLMSRHRGLCWICHKPVQPEGELRMRPSIDHVVPLSRGGKHDKINCRLAHRGCNSKKGARLPLIALMQANA